MIEWIRGRPLDLIVLLLSSVVATSITVWAAAQETQPKEPILAGDFRFTGWETTSVQLGRNQVTWQLVGRLVTARSTQRGVELSAPRMTAVIAAPESGAPRLKSATARGGITFVYNQWAEKRTFRVTATTADYNGDTQTITIKQNVVVVAEDSLYRLHQKGDQVTIYLGENPVRTVVEGNPQRTEAILVAKQPQEGRQPDRMTVTGWSHYVVQQGENRLTWKMEGRPVRMVSSDQQMDFSALEITARVEIPNEGDARLKAANASGGVRFVHYQTEEKRTTQIQADMMEYNDEQQMVVARNNVFVTSEDEQYVLTQKGADQVTAYLGEDPVRVLVEGDPTKTEAVLTPKNPKKKP